MKLKCGDILHCYSNSFLSKTIRKMSDSKYSHSAMVIEIWGKFFIIDSQARGTTIKTIEDWTKKYQYLYSVSRPKYNIDDELKFRAMEKCGDTPYDYVSLLIYQPIYQLCGKWLGKKSDNADRRMYCSEFISYVYKIPHYWSNSPQDVYEFCTKSNLYENYDIFD